MASPKIKQLLTGYGFDDVTIVPGDVTINPDQTNMGFSLGGHDFPIPFVASAVDAVVSPSFAGEMGRVGGLAILNLEGIYTRYEDPYSVIQHIIEVPQDQATALLQRVYSSPIREDLIAKRIQEIKDKAEELWTDEVKSAWATFQAEQEAKLKE